MDQEGFFLSLQSPVEWPLMYTMLWLIAKYCVFFLSSVSKEISIGWQDTSPFSFCLFLACKGIITESISLNFELMLKVTKWIHSRRAVFFWQWVNGSSFSLISLKNVQLSSQQITSAVDILHTSVCVFLYTLFPNTFVIIKNLKLVPSCDPTDLQYTTPIQWSHRWPWFN